MTLTTPQPHAGAPVPSAAEVAHLLTALQSHGLRVEVPMGARAGGAGPADAGMLYVEGVQTTVPTSAAYVQHSPYALRGEDDGSWGIYEDGRRLAGAALAPRPRYYDLTTEDGIPYHQIALLHLDSVASTVLQTCAYWGNDDQCTFCGIGVTLAAGRTIAKKTPAMLAEGPAERERGLERRDPPPGPFAITGDEHQRRAGRRRGRFDEALDPTPTAGEGGQVVGVGGVGGSRRTRPVGPPPTAHQPPPPWIEAAGMRWGWSRPVPPGWKDASCRSPRATDTLARGVKELPQ